MPWVYLLSSSYPGYLAEAGGSLSGGTDLTSYLLGFGPLGVGIVLFGLGLIVPRSVMTAAVDHSRADLVETNKRLIADKEKAENQRDEALKLAQTQVVPILQNFTAATSSLLPILQELVWEREGRDGRERRRER